MVFLVCFDKQCFPKFYSVGVCYLFDSGLKRVPKSPRGRGLRVLDLVLSLSFITS